MDVNSIVLIVVGSLLTGVISLFVGRVTAFLKVVDSIVRAFADMRITAEELREIINNVKDLLKKKNSSPSP